MVPLNDKEDFMQNHSRIEVWYRVGTEQVLLGEVEHSDQINLFSMWRSVQILGTPISSEASANYTLKLFDDDGQEIGRKVVSEKDAEAILGNHHWMVRQCRNLFTQSTPETLQVVAG